MALKVLLARPHDFIVNDMTQWVSGMGFTPLRLETPAELALTPSAEVAAIVISTAVTSAVKASFAEVLDAARAAHPAAPLVFASLSSLASAKQGIASDLARHKLTMHAFDDDKAAWGRPSVALFVASAELKSRREALSAVARHHFRS